MRLLQPVDGSRDCLHAGLELEREELRIPALGLRTVCKTFAPAAGR